MASQLADRIRAAKREVEDLAGRIKAGREARVEDCLAELSKEGDKAYNFTRVRRLQGHFGKVYSMQWAGDSNRLVSASQDGKLIEWNAFTESKLHAINLKSAWVMACAFEQGDSPSRVASGGLDNMCSVFDVATPSPTIMAPTIELTGHDGFLSCCRFIDSGHILTASGDSSCGLWDLSTGVREKAFRDHGGDVMSVSVSPTDPNMFVSGSIDAIARLFDIRAGKVVSSFVGHESDINAVEFMSNGMAFASGSDDDHCKIFDIRARAEIASFGPDGDDGGDSVVGGAVSSVAFSRSGRLLFAGYEDAKALAWEILTESRKWHKLTHNPEGGSAAKRAQNDRISCLGVSNTGHALCTGSWDMELRVWA